MLNTYEMNYLPAEFYSDFLSTAAKQRKPSPIRVLYPLERTPGIISLLAGKPNASTFPFTSISFTARSPGANSTPDVTVKLDGTELEDSLQYSELSGIKPLLDWIYGLQEMIHCRKRGEGWRVSVGAGSQDLIYKAVTSMINPGDSILVESPLYAGIIPMFQDLNCNQIEVETDSKGISSSSLRKILEQWPSGKEKPRFLYTVPYGCNPTGASATLERRREVLKLAKEHNFIILEDDPYFYLYYGTAPRYPSFFALEKAELGGEVGRVLRFDSFSKILSSGIRLGFVSGPIPLLDAIDQHTTTSNLQTSTFTQAIVLKLLDAWDYDGFRAHTETVSRFYAEKRDIFENSMRKYLTGLAEWTTPEAGMFFWFKLLIPSMDGDMNGEGDSDALITNTAFKKGVLAMPGVHFLPNRRPSAYVRASFSTLDSQEDADTAVQRIRDAVLEARAEGGLHFTNCVAEGNGNGSIALD